MEYAGLLVYTGKAMSKTQKTIMYTTILNIAVLGLFYAHLAGQLRGQEAITKTLYRVVCQDEV